MGFAEDVKAFQAKAKAAMNTSVSNSAAKLFTDIVQRSPSSAGLVGRVAPYADDLLINQWYPAANDFSPAINSSTSPTGELSMARIKAMVAQNTFFGQDGFVSLTNNLSYAYRAEVRGWPPGEGGGDYGKWKGAAPYNMVKNAVIAWKGSL
jgi:hypothetical protein